MSQLIVGIYAQDVYRELALSAAAQTIGPATNDTVQIPSLPGQLVVGIASDGRPTIWDNGAGLRLRNQPVDQQVVADGDVYGVGLEGFRQFLTVRDCDDGAAPHRVTLPEDRTVTIGRSSSTTIRYNDGGVSGRHAEIAPIGGGMYRVTDLGSTNGTYVGGTRVNTLHLEIEDVIVVYGHRIVFMGDHLILDSRFMEPRITRLKTYVPGAARNYPMVRIAPRPIFEIPTERVEIPPPAHNPNKPQITMLMSIIPISLMGMTSVLVATTSGSWTRLIMLPMVIGTGFVAVFNYLFQMRKFKRQTNMRIEKYRDRLSKVDDYLKGLWNDQRKFSDMMLPVVDKLVVATEKQNEMFWQRRSIHPDFLVLRLGVGTLPFRVDMKKPASNDALEIDQLKDFPEKLVEKYKDVPGVPISLSLMDTSVVGIVGDRELVVEAAREMLFQVCTLHAYDEVRTALVYNESEDEQWSWARWLPHMWDNDHRARMVGNDPQSAKNVLFTIGSFLRARDGGQKFNKGDKIERPLPHYVVFVAEASLADGNPTISMAQMRGALVGVSVVVLAGGLDELPMACDAILEIGPDTGRVYATAHAQSPLLFRRERLPAGIDIEALTRVISPKRVASMSAEAGLPSSFTFFQMFGITKASELDARVRWGENRTYLGIRAPIGIMGNGELFYMDMITHGPHGLVAGTTGSGKSEMLASFLLSLAVNYSPHDVNMMIIDFKGGALAEQLMGLPHLVGSISNLSGNEVSRALKSIKSELRKRSSVFMNYRDEGGKVINNIRDYRALLDVRRAAEPDMPLLPHLIIVVDEFQQLKKEQPTFMTELISVAITGRSLGVHLILSTQKPAGVVDATIWSNTRFRVCLRMQDETDSREVIRRPDASKIIYPGRLYLQVGDDEIFEMLQSAYSGARMALPQSGASARLSIVGLGGAREVVKLDKSRQTLDVSAPTQLQAVIEHIVEMAAEEGMEPLPGPWREPLPESIPLTSIQKLPKGGWTASYWQADADHLRATVGIVDDPDHQRQMPLMLSFGENGHLGIFGGPGTGKKMMLTTIAISLMLSYPPKDFHLYVLDFGDRSMRLLQGFPHVGGVVLIDEVERVQRLIRMLKREMNERKALLSSEGDANIYEYRKRTGEPLASIMLIVDEYVYLKENYESLLEDFSGIVAEGALVGIYIVLTGVLYFQVGMKLMANVKQTVSMALTDRTNYADIVGNTGGLYPEDIPGRGLIRNDPPLIFQTAYVAMDEDRNAVFAALGNRMTSVAGGVAARPVPSMPETLYLHELLENEEVSRTLRSQPDVIPVGIDMRDMMPVYINPFAVRSMLLTGPMGTGKTALLRCLIMSMALRRGADTMGLIFIDSAGMELFGFRNLPQALFYATLDDPEGVRAVLHEAKLIADERRAARRAVQQGEEAAMEDQRMIVIAIHDIAEFVRISDNRMRDMLYDLISARVVDILVIAAGNLNEVGGFDPTLKAIRDAQTGFLINAHVVDFSSIFNVRSTSSSRVFLPGEGFLVPGNGTTVRLRLPFMPGDLIGPWVEALANNMQG